MITTIFLNQKKVLQFFLNAGLNVLGINLNKKLSSITGKKTKLTNNEIKNITEIIRSFENRRISLKGTTEKNYYLRRRITQ